MSYRLTKYDLYDIILYVYLCLFGIRHIDILLNDIPFVMLLYTIKYYKIDFLKEIMLWR